MLKLKNKILPIIFVLLFSCSSVKVNEKKIITIKGSDTMLHLTEVLSKAFVKNHQDITFRIYGGGTKTGIDELLKGNIDICTASRELTSSEAKKLAEYYGSIGMYYLIAKDAVCIYVNPEMNLTSLSATQLNKIFTCKIYDMKQLNNSAGKIQLAIRNKKSGTRKFIKDIILPDEDFCSKAKEFSTTSQITKFVEKTKNSFGFGGIGLAKGVKKISINGISPSIKNIKSDKYPLTRYLHFFTSRSYSGAVKKFINWVLSPEGQKVIQKEGFIPLWEITY